MTNENTQGNIEEGRKLEITEEARSVENQSRESAAGISAETIERFWKKVNKNGPTQPHMSSQCWEWMAAKCKGYGSFAVRRKTFVAHRISFVLSGGILMDGNLACHRCDNPSCVRPDHIFSGTHADNSLDRAEKGRTAKGHRSGALKHPERRPRGEMHGKSKLTEEKVIQIRSRYAAGGISKRALAVDFGVTNTSILSVIARKTWTHVL